MYTIILREKKSTLDARNRLSKKKQGAKRSLWSEYERKSTPPTTFYGYAVKWIIYIYSFSSISGIMKRKNYPINEQGWVPEIE